MHFWKKSKINSHKTENQFTQGLQKIKNKYLSRDKIKRINCVMGYFNMKMNGNLVYIIDLQLCGALK